MAEETLLLDALACGDKPSVLSVAYLTERALKEKGVAVFMVDAIGRIHFMPPAAVEVRVRPKLSFEELHQLDESKAIAVLGEQQASEEEIIDYLKKRDIALSAE